MGGLWRVRRPPLAPGAYQVCAAASLVFSPMACFSAVWSWGAQPDCGLCVAGLVQYKFSKFTRCSKFNRSFFANFVDKLADDGDAMMMMMMMMMMMIHCCPWLNAARHLGVSCYRRGSIKYRSRN